MGYYPRPDGGGCDSYSPGGYSHTDGHHNWAAVERPPDPSPPVTSSYSVYPDRGDDGQSSSGTGGHSYPMSNAEQLFGMLFGLMLWLAVCNIEFTLEVIFRLIFAWYEYHWVETAVMFAVAIVVTKWAKYQELRYQDLLVSPLADVTGGTEYQEVRCQDLPSGPKLSEARDRATKMGRLAVLLWWAAVLVTVALSVKTAFLTPQPEAYVQKMNRELVRGHLYHPEDVSGSGERPVKKLLWQEAPGPKVNWIVVGIELYRRSPTDRSVPKAEVKRLLEELADPVTGGLVGLLLNFDADEYARHSLRARVRLEELRLAEPTNDALRDNPDRPKHQSLKMMSK